MEHSAYYAWCAASLLFWLTLYRAIRDYRRGRGPKPLALIVAAIGIAPAHALVAGYAWFIIEGRSPWTDDGGYAMFLLGLVGGLGALLCVPAALLAATLPPWELGARTIWAGKLAALAFALIAVFIGGSRLP